MESASSSLSIETIPGASLRPLPWKNGGGVTREVAVAMSAQGEFNWRVSIADVDQPGPFSLFERVDRVLVMTQGDLMVLKRGDEVHRLARWEPFEFAGEAPITAHLPSGPTRDFNLMVRRAHGRGFVHVHHRSEHLAVIAGVVLFHCAAGSFSVGVAGSDEPPVTLSEGDTLRADIHARTIFDVSPLTANSTLIDARIEPFGTPHPANNA